MKYLAWAVIAVCAVMIFQNWDSPVAIAWTVAFCGWTPHCFSDTEATHGNS